MIQPATDPAAPPDILLNLVAILLAPIFLGVTAGDLALARRTVLHTINDYRARNQADLVAVAQIVGFGLAALGSLGLSVAGDIPLSMILRLRGNAIACNRAAELNRKARVSHQAEAPRPPVAPEAAKPETTEPEIAEPQITEYEPPPQPDVFLSEKAAFLLAAESQARLEPEENLPPTPTSAATRTPEEKRHHQMWAIALAKESSEIAASLPSLPPAERHAAAMRAGRLSSTVHDLAYGTHVQPLQPGALSGKPPPPA